jgi:predicted transposase/invertase (TIGR01784 family)
MDKTIIERLDPLNDYLFFKIMGEKGDEEQLMAFLNAVLKKTGNDVIAHIEIIDNRKFTGEVLGDKASILDVRAETGDGVKVNIEVQIGDKGNMEKRSLYYWGLEYTRVLDAGQDYDKLPKVIAINIVDFEMKRTEGFHTSYHIWEDEEDVILSDVLEIHFIDMVKFRRLKGKDIANNRLHRWLTFLNRNTNNNILEEVINMDTAIQKAQEKMIFVTTDKEELRAYQMRMMAISDQVSGLNSARREGKMEGRMEGRIEGEKIGEKKGRMEGKKEGRMEGEKKGRFERDFELVKRQAAKGKSIEEIADFMDISVKQVQKILLAN